MLKKPFLGAAYYPEAWDECEIAHDIGQMKQAGITCVRVAEFAWLSMEPERGKFEFEWLHRVIDTLGENGISVILGTPTAAPPIWLIREHPDVSVLRENGIRPSHGGRRHCCSNNLHYIEASERIVEAMGREFGRDPNVVAFQLDNEIYTLDKGCMCDDCMERFHRTLEKKYGSIEELNRRWDLNTWSQGYGSFDEVPAPVIGWHTNPHLAYEWITCQQEGNMEFIWRQAEILRNYTEVPLGTDMVPMGGLDYEKTTEPLDIVMFNHYHVPENFGEAVMWFDFVRTLKDKPFVITETATTWNGTTVFAQYMIPEGFCRVNSWLPIALGGEGNMYWLWRQHWGGQELLHGSVVSPAGRPAHVFGEIRQTASELKKAAEICNATKIDTSVAMHFTTASWNLFLQHPLLDGFAYVPELARIHKAITKTGLRPDVIGAEHSLDEYRLIFSPFVMTLENGKLAERISAWVKDGGIWVAGPATDIRNDIGAQYTDRALGMIEGLLGVKLDYTLPIDGTVLRFAWKDGRELKCEKWVECYSGAGEALASVVGGHSAVVGKSVIRKVSCGKGTVILCGTIMPEKDLYQLVDIAVKTAGIHPYAIEGDLQVIPRKGEKAECLMLVETGNAPAGVQLDEDMTDLITGQKIAAGRWPVEPYGIHILTRMG